MLTINNVKRSFTESGMRVDALKGVSYEFPERGLVCIVGRSGSGKSTLLKILAGLDRANEGEVLFCGEDVNAMSEGKRTKYRRESVGLIFQEQNFFPALTIRENVSFYAEADEALAEKLGIKELLDRKTSELSGGQLQRATIMRTLLQNPRVILADEPTGALDEGTGREIFTLLKEISREKLVIVVTHDMDGAKEFADETVRLRSGRILEVTVAKERESGLAEQTPQNAPKKFSHLNKWGILSFWRNKVKAIVCIVVCLLSAVSVLFSVATTYGGEKWALAEFLVQGAEDYPYLLCDAVPGKGGDRETLHYVFDRAKVFPTIQEFALTEDAEYTSEFGYHERTKTEPLGEDGLYLSYNQFEFETRITGKIKEATRTASGKTYADCVLTEEGEKPLSDYRLEELDGLVGEKIKLYASMRSVSIQEVPTLVCKGVLQRQRSIDTEKRYMISLQNPYFVATENNKLHIDYVLSSKGCSIKGFMELYDYLEFNGIIDARGVSHTLVDVPPMPTIYGMEETTAALRTAMDFLSPVLLIVYAAVPAVVTYLELRKRKREVQLMRALGVSRTRISLSLLLGLALMFVPVIVLSVVALFPVIALLNTAYGVPYKNTVMPYYYLQPASFLWSALIFTAGILPVVLVVLFSTGGRNFAKGIRAE